MWLLGPHRDLRDDETLRSLRDRFSSLERKTPPSDRGDSPATEVHWVSPKLVAEVGFEAWTHDDRLRQPRFHGLSRDKEPTDVINQEPTT